MATGVLPGDWRTTGTLSPAGFVPPSECIGDSAIETPAAGEGISAAKVRHQHRKTTAHCNHATDAAVDRRQAHRVSGATGEIVSFGVTCTVAATSTGTVTLNLFKNGSTILTAPISLTSSTAVNTLLAAAGFSSTSLVAGDILESVISAASGSTLPKGVATHLVLEEDGE